MSIQLPPTDRDSRRLLLHTEEVVRRCSLYHKYTVRTDRRRNPMQAQSILYPKFHQPKRFNKWLACAAALAFFVQCNGYTSPNPLQLLWRWQRGDRCHHRPGLAPL